MSPKPARILNRTVSIEVDHFLISASEKTGAVGIAMQNSELHSQLAMHTGGEAVWLGQCAHEMLSVPH